MNSRRTEGLIQYATGDPGTASKSAVRIGNMRDRLPRPVRCDGRAERAQHGPALEETDEGGLWVDRRVSRADDVGSRLDLCLLHHTEPKIGERDEAITEDDLPSPLLECREE